MASNEDRIAQFSSMTGSTPDRAKFFLEAAGWDIGGALETYFDSGAGGNVEAMVEDNENEQQQTGGITDWFRQDVQRAMPSAPLAVAGTSGNERSAEPKKNTVAGSSRIATLGSMRGKQESDEDSDENDKDRNQEFYVGSGQEVLGPKKRNPDEIISSVFQSARQHGAEQVEETTSQNRDRPAVFAGIGVRLGATADESRSVGGGSSVAGPGSSEAGSGQSSVVVLRMWRNGFTIDQGPLRLYADPANQEFMEYVKQGRVPRELVSSVKGGDLKVQMEDHRDKEYEKPRQPVQYFTGIGNMLGSPSPAVVTGVATKHTSEEDRKAAEEKAKSAIRINSSLPTTHLQVRLRDGSRLIHTFNEVSTVGDLRRFIQTARPEYGGQNFQILAGYPSKPITDDKASLKDANLLNATVTIK